MGKLETCNLCDTPSRVLCPDGACVSCHKLISFEECATGTFNAKQLLRLGYPIEEVKRLYPEARLEGEWRENH